MLGFEEEAWVALICFGDASDGRHMEGAMGMASTQPPASVAGGRRNLGGWAGPIVLCGHQGPHAQ